jgi:hypothetical protein
LKPLLKNLYLYNNKIKIGGIGPNGIPIQIESKAEVRAEVIQEIFSEIDGATRGLPGKQSGGHIK